MSFHAFPTTVNHARLSSLAGVALCLFLPILFIYLLPSEETFFQNLFQGEGIVRILRCAWSFRSSWLISLKKAGVCSLLFGLEELLQEACLYVLI
jgi:hypothetical protein